MHLVQREHLPEPLNGDSKRKHKHDTHQEEITDVIITPTNPNSSPAGCCDACSIL
jgi:hypothetical protein